MMTRAVRMMDYGADQWIISGMIILLALYLAEVIGQELGKSDAMKPFRRCMHSQFIEIYRSVHPAQLTVNDFKIRYG